MADNQLLKLAKFAIRKRLVWVGGRLLRNINSEASYDEHKDHLTPTPNLSDWTFKRPH